MAIVFFVRIKATTVPVFEVRPRNPDGRHKNSYFYIIDMIIVNMNVASNQGYGELDILSIIG